MKTKWHLYISWSVLSLALLSCAADIYESTSALRNKKIIKLGTPKSKPDAIKLSTTGERKSSQRLSSSTSPLSQLSFQTSPVTPRSVRSGKLDAKIQSDFASLPDVSVTCSTSDFVVRVKPAFYGLGADAAELKLGSTCKSNGVLRPYGDLLFTYPLTACDSQRELTHGYLVYKLLLHYEPSPKRFPSRAHRVDVGIECRYQRNHHVYQLAVQPTWQTAVVRKRLKGRPNDFQIELMNDSWSRPVKSQVYQLGQTVNFQVSAPQLPTGGKLYISSCYAAPSSGSKSSLKYTIIDNFGCMLDSKRDPGASQFISRTDKTVRFSMKAFQFISDPDTEVDLHCKLFATSGKVGPAQKSCTYRGNRWEALAGDNSICECCDSQCVTSKPRRAMMEGSASSGSLLVSDQPHTAEDGFFPVSPSLVSMRREGKTTSHENLWENADVLAYDDGEEEQGYMEEEEELKDEEESRGRLILGMMTEPELEKSVFRERVLVEERKKSEEKDSRVFREDGSGYEVEEDFLESGEEERFEGEEDKQLVHLSHQKEDVVLHNWAQLEQMLRSHVGLQREVQPLNSEGEGERKKYTGRSEEVENTRASEVEKTNDDDLADVVDDGQLTWYFTWR
ncbi:zona pellucida sperm-binding protein 3 [Thunnus albacares]|uniref:zona pellucida sperm-binding protein 3 n=1 Tax=Thunnus albacares TaxID=8236 RepID=UPI001CF65A94|nr:zona pellucida sperm-binding protein 3 [Thunnus albacares]